MDKLESMMELQDKFQKRLGVDFTKLNAVERAASMRDNFVYLDQELQEALYEMPFFKHWKDYSGMSDDDVEKAWAKVKMELIDAFHFFMNMLLCAGMSAEEVYKTYISEKYKSAVYVIPPVAASVFFIFLYNILAIPQFYFERTKFLMLSSITAAIINITLNYIKMK